MLVVPFPFDCITSLSVCVCLKDCSCNVERRKRSVFVSWKKKRNERRKNPKSNADEIKRNQSDATIVSPSVLLLSSFTRLSLSSLAEALRARLQEVHKRRTELEKVRDDVIKSLKTIHDRITLRRKEGLRLSLSLWNVVDDEPSFSSGHVEEEILSGEEEDTALGRSVQELEDRSRSTPSEDCPNHRERKQTLRQGTTPSLLPFTLFIVLPEVHSANHSSRTRDPRCSLPDRTSETPSDHRRQSRRSLVLPFCLSREACVSWDLVTKSSRQ